MPGAIAEGSETPLFPVERTDQQTSLQIGFMPGWKLRGKPQLPTEPDVELEAFFIFGFEYARQKSHFV